MTDQEFRKFGIDRAPASLGNSINVTHYTGGGTSIEQNLQTWSVMSSAPKTISDVLAMLDELKLDAPVPELAQRHSAVNAAIKKARVSPDYEHDNAVSAQELSRRREEATARENLAAKSSYNKLLREMQAVGEAGWYALLQPVLDDAIKAVQSDRANAMRLAESRWTLIQKLCGSLRAEGILPNVKGAAPADYHFSEPEALFFHRVMTASRVREVSRRDDAVMHFRVVRPDAPQITLAKALELGVGPMVKTAQDVVSHSLLWRAAFDVALYGEQQPASPATRRVRMIGA